VIRYSQRAQECILIGHAGHPEVAGTLGQYRHPEGAIYLVETLQDIAQLKVKDPTQLGYVTQTTLSVDDTQAMVAALRQRFPAIQGPNKEDICYATQNRQTAVKQLAEQTEVVLVIGSKNSSNSNRLQELVRRYNKPAYLIDEVKQIDNAWLVGKESVGITAGASAPEVLVQQVVAYLQQQFKVTAVTEVAGETENVYFALPKSLRTEPVAKAIATPILPTV
jgi:4-hydroxy-3-methylbut-2-enyl diphosphate reductase